MFRIRLKTMILGLTVAAVIAACIPQIGMTDAQFEFLESDLLTDERGLLHGRIRWNFKDKHIQRNAPWHFVCSVKNLPAKPDMVAKIESLRPGAVRTIRYRDLEIAGLKKQDPFRRYIGAELGIDSDHVVGYAWFDGWTEVIIDGM